MLPNLSGLAREPKCFPCNDPFSQPPNWTLPGVSDPNLPENAGKSPEELGNVCGICLAPLAGPAEENAELPDELERVRSTNRQYHRWCLAKWAWNHDTDPSVPSRRLQPSEIARLLAFRPRPAEDENEQAVREQTEMADAVRSGDLERVQRLVAEGAPVNYDNDPYGSSLLVLAIRNNRLEMVRLLIREGIDVNAHDSRNANRSPLILAVRENQPVIASDLINNGAQLEDVDDAGHNALFWAILGNGVLIVGLLLAVGANPNAVNRRLSNQTPLTAAARFAAETMVHLLLVAGADVNATTDSGFTALMYAVTSDQDGGANSTSRLRTVQALIDRGADMNLRSLRGVTALDRATARGYVDIERVLRDAGARGEGPK